MPEGVEGQEGDINSVTPHLDAEPKVLDPEQYGDYTIPTRVYGKDGTATLADLIQRGQKDIAADQRLAELSEREAELEHDRDLASAIKKGWSTKDPDLMIRGLTAAGVPESEARRVVLGEGTQAAQSGGSSSGGATADSGEGVSTMDDLVSALGNTALGQQVSEMYRDYTKSKETTAQNQKIGEIAEALDNHPELGIIMKKLDQDGKRAVLGMARQAISRRLSSFPQWGPRPVAAGLSDLTKQLESLGISPEGPATLGVGPSETPETGIHLDERAKAVLNEKDSGQGSSLYGPDASQSILRRIAKGSGLIK